jgi:hypothetical protein
MNDKTKVLILSLLVTGMGAALLWHFRLIHLYGQLLIQEPSMVILWAEMVLFSSITLFGIWCFARVILKGKED